MKSHRQHRPARQGMNYIQYVPWRHRKILRSREIGSLILTSDKPHYRPPFGCSIFNSLKSQVRNHVFISRSISSLFIPIFGGFESSGVSLADSLNILPERPLRGLMVFLLVGPPTGLTVSLLAGPPTGVTGLISSRLRGRLKMTYQGQVGG